MLETKLIDKMTEEGHWDNSQGVSCAHSGNDRGREYWWSFGSTIGDLEVRGISVLWVMPTAEAPYVALTVPERELAEWLILVLSGRKPYRGTRIIVNLCPDFGSVRVHNLHPQDIREVKSLLQTCHGIQATTESGGTRFADTLHVGTAA